MNFVSTERYFNLVAILRRSAKIVGTDLFDPNYKKNFLTCLVGATACSVLVLYILMFFRKPTVMSIFEGLVVSLLASQGLAKITIAAANSGKFYDLFDRLRHMYVDDEKVVQNQDCLKKCIDRSFVINKFLTVCYISVSILYCLLPVFSYVYYNTTVLILPIHLPFLNISSTFGYVVNLVYQVGTIGIGSLGILTFDTIFATHIMHFIPTVNLMKIRLEELNAELLASSKDIEKIRQKVRCGIVQHQAIISYMVALNQTYSTVGAVQIGCASSNLVLSVFLFVWKKWIVGPALGVASIFQVGEYCILGTVTQIQNEVVADLIYNTLWYLMPVQEQKLILFMIMQASTPRELLAGKFAKLNVETFLQVLKMAYSMTMMIIEFLG